MKVMTNLQSLGFSLLSLGSLLLLRLVFTSKSMLEPDRIRNDRTADNQLICISMHAQHGCVTYFEKMVSFLGEVETFSSWKQQPHESHTFSMCSSVRTNPPAK